MKRKKALRKEFFMEIRKTYTRFLSICLIVMLGTAFFAGIRATNPDMHRSADSFFDESRLMDIRVLSTLGLTDEDVAAIREIDGIEAAAPVYTKDVLTTKNDKQLVLKLISAGDEMNLVTVDEGRMPQNPGECLVDNLLIDKSGYKIGDTITVTSGDDTKISDIVKEETLTITGCGRLASYLSLTRDSSQIGHGSVDGFVILTPDSFSMEVYTEIDITVKDAQALDCYGDVYEAKINDIVDRVEAIADGRCQIRYDNVTADAAQSIEDAKKEVADGEKKLADAEDELADAEDELTDAKKEVADGEKQLADAKAEMADGESKIADAKVKVENGEKELAKAKAEVESNAKKLADARKEIEENEKTLNEKASQLALSEEKIADGKLQLLEGWTAYEEGLFEAQAGLDQLEEKSQQFEAAVAQVVSGREALEMARPQIEALRGQIIEGEAGLSALAQQLDTLTNRQSELTEAIEYYEAAVAAGNEEVRGAYEEALAQKAEVSAGIDVVNGKISEINANLSMAKAAVEDFEARENQIQEGEAALGDIDEQRQLIESNRQQLEYAINVTLPEAKAQLTQKQEELDNGEAIISEGKTAIEDGRRQLENAKLEVADGEAALDAGRKTISENETKLENSKKEIADSERKIAEGKAEISENEAKLIDAKKEIADGEAKLSEGRAEYEDALAENRPKLEDAKAEIAQAEEDLTALKLPKWYVLDRDYIETCVEYAQDAERIGKIGDVFPVIFFLVAALVSLTTMTRMVEEERTQIGTLKALGYSKGSIALKYVLYAFLATLIGGTAGTILGQKVLPLIIMRAYSILYVGITDYEAPLHMGYTLTALGAAVLSTTIAVVAACYKELLSVPAKLMRPVAPKAGKRVWLEKVTFIWKRLSFSYKAAVRNLFRYKKRFFMTVIGIGGCMGLLLVGFGVKDSIMTIGDKQFNDIRIYDSTVNFSEDSSYEERQEVYHQVLNEENTKAALMAIEETVDISKDISGKGERSAYLFVPSETDRMSDFIVLKNRVTHESYDLDDEGAVISEKLASLLDVGEGDEIYIEISDMNRVPVKVSHIVENYYFHYVYVSPALYEKIYGEKTDYSEIFVDFEAPSEAYEKEFSGKYLTFDSVSGISYTRTMSERIASMITSMDAIIYVIIISAGLLAFVVLYNLNNINISERKRELATLKVLGFFDGEVSIYVLRENVMLTLIGAILGIFIGKVLHRFVILTAEVDLMMFGRDIYFKSYIYSVLLTFAFSAVVSVVMHRKLKKIDMIESLKSVE